MAEMVIGPKGQMPWDKANKDQVLDWRDEKASVYHSLRIDVDEDKGPHYNVMVSTQLETFKACFRFNAPESKDPVEWAAKIQARWSR